MNEVSILKRKNKVGTESKLRCFIDTSWKDQRVAEKVLKGNGISFGSKREHRSNKHHCKDKDRTGSLIILEWIWDGIN